jgi:hypothetical protein
MGGGRVTDREAKRDIGDKSLMLDWLREEPSVKLTQVPNYSER